MTPRRSLSGGALVARALLVVCLAGCSVEGEPPAALPPAVGELGVPWPDLAQADPRVREQIETQRAEVEAALANLSSESARAAAAELLGDTALLLMTYEFMDAAGVCLEHSMSLAPGDHRWSYLAGYLNDMLGRSELALAQLETALELDGDYLPTRVRLAEVKMTLGQTDEARRLFDRVLEEEPGTARALAGLARLAVEEGDDQRAAALYERALELEPAANSLHYVLSQVYRRLGDPERVELHLARRGDIQVPLADPLLDAVGTLGQSSSFFMTQASQAMNNRRFDIAAESYRKALELDATLFAAYRGLSFSLLQLGDLEGSRAVLKRALADGGRGEETDADQRADIHRRLGESYVLEGDDERAGLAFEAGLRESPTRADLHQLLANSLARRGRFGEAVEHYDVVLRGLTDDTATLRRRGAALLRLGEIERGLADFERAAETAPDDVDVRRQLIAALRHAGRESRARHHERALETAGHGGSPTPASLLTKGRLSVARGDFEEAERLFRDAVAADPESVEAVVLHASALGQLGRYDDSAARFRGVLRGDPRNRQAWLGELTALLLGERFGVARERMREALEVYPRDAALAHALARLLVSSPLPADRNGALALEMLERLQSFERSRELRETYAMALAEVGRYADAADAQRQVSEGSDPGSVPRARLRAYERRSPWVAQSPGEVVDVLRAQTRTGS